MNSDLFWIAPKFRNVVTNPLDRKALIPKPCVRGALIPKRL